MAEEARNLDVNNEDEKVKEELIIRILIIDKGFGNELERIKHLKGTFKEENVEKVILTEPSDKLKSAGRPQLRYPART